MIINTYYKVGYKTDMDSVQVVLSSKIDNTVKRKIKNMFYD